MNNIDSEIVSKRVPKSKFIIFLAIIVLIAIASIRIIYNSQTANVQDLMTGIKPNKVSTKTLHDDFISATTDFSIKLFKQSFDINKNSLISPTSVALALGMTSNGAAGKTLDQFKTLLGGNKFSIEQLNNYYYTMNSILLSDEFYKVRLANSIWYKQDESLNLKPDFLQTNADYYKAAAYKADFNSHGTVNEINNWAKSNTDGSISKMASGIDDESKMLLANTAFLEANWSHVYSMFSVKSGNFTLPTSDTVNAKYMLSHEIYLSSDSAQGFIKPYADGKYSFVALLPNEDISIEEYIKKLDGKSFLDFINYNSEEYNKILNDGIMNSFYIRTKPAAFAFIGLPKFKYNYDISLAKPLINLGFTDGFRAEKANFSKMVSSAHSNNICIGNILHKTSIQVDERGTNTHGDIMANEGVEKDSAIQKYVFLDRPFIFAIIENKTKLPLFIGTVMDPSK